MSIGLLCPLPPLSRKRARGKHYFFRKRLKIARKGRRVSLNSFFILAPIQVMQLDGGLWIKYRLDL